MELNEVQDQRPGCSSGAPEEVRPSASSPLLASLFFRHDYLLSLPLNYVVMSPS